MASRKKPKLRQIPNPVRVQGFNVQRITVPGEDPDRFIFALLEEQKSWSKNINLVAELKNHTIRKNRRAIWLGLGLASALVAGSLGMLYALGL